MNKSPDRIAKGDPTAYMGALGEAVYCLKKLIVMLATEQMERERVEGKPFKTSMPKTLREYTHTIVRVPLDPSPGPGGFAGGTKRKRKYLVRGYVWVKNTRPLEEQRWITPFFRGDAELGTVEHEHYEVG